MRPEGTEPASVEELRQLALLEGEDPAAIEWLAQYLGVRRFETGDAVMSKGDAVQYFVILLEGEVHITRPEDVQGSVMIREQGQPMGVLPFSRMRVSPGNAVAVSTTRLALMDREHLRELVYRAPVLAQRLVQEMTDRTREFTQLNERGSKMLALGKLAAGLSHELNNPASAALRASARIAEVLLERRRVVVPEAALAVITALDAAAECGAKLDALDRADREGEFELWLSERGLPERYAVDLVDAGLTPASLADIAPQMLGCVVSVLVMDYEILCLAEELKETSRRIADLVDALKSYSYMDQTPVTEVDIERGLDLTLRMYGYRLGPGIELRREFAGNLPVVRANGGELNQVWGNLIENALDALDKAAGAKVLTIRTCHEVHGILVEFEDNGAGIAPELQGRVFEPFFTTKPVGEGTGLGLDIVQRIVRAHKGSVRLESTPGQTVLQVRLPL